MSARRPALLALAALIVVGLAPAASAQSMKSYSVSRPPAPTAPAPTRGGGGSGGYHGGDGGYRGGGHFGGWGGVVGGIITAIPQMPPGRYVDDDAIDDGPPPSRRQPQRAARRNSNAPPAGERRMVPDEVVIELRNAATPAQIAALQRRFRLTRLGQTPISLTGTTFYRWRIPDRRSVATVVRQLEADRLVASAQPNYQFALQQSPAAPAEGDPAQYELAKLHLPEAHALAKGDQIRVAVIDSAIDDAHPDLNTSASSPSGAYAGMVLRSLVDDGVVPADRVVLAGARAWDPEEERVAAEAGIRAIGADAATPEAVAEAVAATGADAVYLHVDLDVLDPAELRGLLDPEPFGIAATALIATLRGLVERFPLAGATIASYAPTGPEDLPEDGPTILRLIGALSTRPR